MSSSYGVHGWSLKNGAGHFVVLVYLGIYSNPDVIMPGLLSGSVDALDLSIAPIICSFLTNLVATSLVGWTLWAHLKFLRVNMANQQYRSFKLWRILYLLADAGALYALLQYFISAFNRRQTYITSSSSNDPADAATQPDGLLNLPLTSSSIAAAVGAVVQASHNFSIYTILSTILQRLSRPS
ncbi:hypothetical protein C0995_013443 [Termitomyces sp. Mi166|nr:hypothetical protein C0995_013443 [Termitomyces sp. Mi166\